MGWFKKGKNIISDAAEAVENVKKLTDALAGGAGGTPQESTNIYETIQTTNEIPAVSAFLTQRGLKGAHNTIDKLYKVMKKSKKFQQECGNFSEEYKKFNAYFKSHSTQIIQDLKVIEESRGGLQKTKPAYEQALNDLSGPDFQCKINYVPNNRALRDDFVVARDAAVERLSVAMKKAKDDWTTLCAEATNDWRTWKNKAATAMATDSNDTAAPGVCTQGNPTFGGSYAAARFSWGISECTPPKFYKSTNNDEERLYNDFINAEPLYLFTQIKANYPKDYEKCFTGDYKKYLSDYELCQLSLDAKRLPKQYSEFKLLFQPCPYSNGMLLIDWLASDRPGELLKEYYKFVDDFTKKRGDYRFYYDKISDSRERITASLKILSAKLSALLSVIQTSYGESAYNSKFQKARVSATPGIVNNKVSLPMVLAALIGIVEHLTDSKHADFINKKIELEPINEDNTVVPVRTRIESDLAQAALATKKRRTFRFWKRKK